MAKAKLSDKEAKDILRKWPGRSKKLWAVLGGGGFWLRAQPIDKGSKIKSPRIDIPGSKLFATQPDGMYVFLRNPKFADIVAIDARITRPRGTPPTARKSCPAQASAFQDLEIPKAPAPRLDPQEPAPGSLPTRGVPHPIPKPFTQRERLSPFLLRLTSRA